MSVRVDGKHVRILVLILSSLASLFLAISGVYLIANFRFGFDPHVKSLMVLFFSLFGFAVGVFVFWGVVDLLTLGEVES